MEKMKGKVVVSALMVVLVVFMAVSPRGARAGEPRVIEIHAKRFGFTPDQITLKKGETVKIRLVSEDVTHGFFLRPLKIDEEVSPGQPTDILLTPEQTGTFTTICDHFCGVNHGNMKMTIVVSE